MLDTNCHWLSFEVHFTVVISSVLTLLVTIAVASVLLEPEFATRHLLPEDNTLQSNPRAYFSALCCPITCSRRAANDRKHDEHSVVKRIVHGRMYSRMVVADASVTTGRRLSGRQ